MAVKSYRPSEVSVSFGGANITGYGDGDFLSISMNNDFFTHSKGADGESLRSSTEDESAVIELRLMQGSESNDVMQGFFIADKLGDVGGLPFLTKDNSGRMLASAASAWIRREPDIVRSQEGTIVVWTLETDNLQGFIGGH